MKRFINLIFAFIFTSCITMSAFGEIVWHCSRSQLTSSMPIENKHEDGEFSIASTGLATDIIQVSLQDIFDVFAGTPVRISGVSLSACFISGDEPMTRDALKSLGLSAATLQRLTKQANIVHSHIYAVPNEGEMNNCIAHHYPAVGYLAQTQWSNYVGPCF